MGTIETTVRPLTEKERRLLSSALAWRKRRQQTLPRRMLLIGLAIFASFSAITVIATVADKGGPAWYYCLLISFAITLLISLWSYFDLRPKFQREVDVYRRALLRNEARVTRIQSSSIVEFEEQEDEGACYAFQLDGDQVVFVSGQDFYPSARFPNSDFSVIKIYADDGKLVEHLIEKNGVKLKPLRKISFQRKSRIRIPENFETINADLEHIEEVLSQRELPQPSDI